MAEQITEEKFLEDLSNVRASIEGIRQINLVGMSRELNRLAKKYTDLSGSRVYDEFSEYNNSCIKALEEGRDNTFDNKRGTLNSLDKIMGHYPVHTV